MAWTYTTLVAAIKSYTQSYETSFEANIDNFITQAEDRISKAVILPANRKSATIVLVEGSQTADLPDDFLAPFELRVNDAGAYTPVDYVDVSLIREAFPNPLDVGVPRWYSMYSPTQIILGPSPDEGLTGWLNYFHIPESIVTAQTSWLGTYAPNCLLYGCLAEAYTFLKGEADLMTKYETAFSTALDGVRKLGEGMDMGDAYRMGEVRVRAGRTGAPIS